MAKAPPPAHRRAAAAPAPAPAAADQAICAGRAAGSAAHCTDRAAGRAASRAVTPHGHRSPNQAEPHRPAAAPVAPPQAAPAVTAAAPVQQQPPCRDRSESRRWFRFPVAALRWAATTTSPKSPFIRSPIKPFAIGKFPVTVREWNECAAAKACGFTATGSDDAPITDVNWNDAKQYAAWLAQATGKHTGCRARPNGNTPREAASKRSIGGATNSSRAWSIARTAPTSRARSSRSRSAA